RPGPLLPVKLPGVDIEASLEELGGNKRLLANLLLEFKKNYGAAAVNIRTALERGEVDFALKLLHGLKGVSGVFAADALYDAALALEKGVKVNGAMGVEDLLGKFEKALARVVASARLVENIRSKETPPA
ncbi:MAG: hypothetical protein GY859_40375, partial [Desulfobacterales bacterium]|nr:hypothetical protein [Desulfobacterales bacterium]